MGLPDAAAEFAREVVAALSGETGRDQRAAERELAELQEKFAVERMQRKQAVAELRGVQRQAHVLRIAVKDVLDNDGDLLDESRRTRLSRAYRWSESPAEGAARLRVE